MLTLESTRQCLLIPPTDNTIGYDIKEAIPLCDENYFYCAVPKGVIFPIVEGVPVEWYGFQGQLEFRKYQKKNKEM